MDTKVFFQDISERAAATCRSLAEKPPFDSLFTPDDFSLSPRERDGWPGEIISAFQWPVHGYVPVCVRRWI